MNLINYGGTELQNQFRLQTHYWTLSFQHKGTFDTPTNRK